MKISRDKLRLIELGAVVVLISCLFLLRLSQIQIVEGEDYLQQQQQGTQKTQTIKAARGEIVDRNGSPFAKNEVSYNVVFDMALSPDGTLNSTILKLINIFNERNEEYNDSLPLSRTMPVQYDGSDDEIERLKGKNFLDLNTYATADEAFYWLKERYELQDYTDEEARAIAGVRYEMEKEGYSLSVRYTFAEDISLETAVLLRQYGSDLPGVDVEEAAVRSYVDGDLAPHIVGRVGAIFADELDSYLSSGLGYSRDDLVGKEGIERAYESVLKGTDGVRVIELDADSNVVGIYEQQAAVPGDTVVLTIDKTIQRVAKEALEDEIAYLQENAKPGEGKEADAGAVVVVDIKQSEVLAAVTYPSYDLSTYSEDYAENASNSLYPFLNRAFSGVYAPGSCFKPVTAVAGLTTGVIDPTSRVTCTGIYTFYPSYQPTCLSSHGSLNVAEALRHSCNIFFYDTGRKLGIETLNSFARSLGLGSLTGIELTEALGTQTSPDSINPGDALQTAIGQLDNGYTPIQLANYTATLARNGERRKLSIVKSISSYYDYTDVIEEHEQVVEEKLDVPDYAFETVREGMVMATHDVRGTSYSYLGDYPIQIASKTGTPQTNDFPNSTFICYAPADDPEIAIAVVIEKGWHGYTGAPVARAILDAYFFPETLQDDESGTEEDGEESFQTSASQQAASQPSSQTSASQPAAPQNSAQPESSSSSSASSSMVVVYDSSSSGIVPNEE